MLTGQNPTPFSEVVLPALSGTEDVCHKHPDRRGVGLCTQCERTFCGSCLQWHGPVRSLACAGCRSRSAATAVAGGLARLARQPLVYVLLFVLLGAVSFIRNQAENTPAAILERESKLSWFRRPTGVRYIHQAMQSRLRARYLEKHGQEREAQRWYGLVHQALTKAESYTRGARRPMDFAIGKAGALGKSGQPLEGLAGIAQVEDEVGNSPVTMLPFLHLRAELNWAAGNRDKALSDWQELLKRTQAADSFHDVGAMIDDAVEKMGGGLFEAAVIAHLQAACDTTPGKLLWRRRALDALIARNLDSIQFESTGRAEPQSPSGMTLERFE